MDDEVAARLIALEERFRQDIAVVHRSLKDYKKANDDRVAELQGKIEGLARVMTGRGGRPN